MENGEGQRQDFCSVLGLERGGGHKMRTIPHRAPSRHTVHNYNTQITDLPVVGREGVFLSIRR